MSINELAAKAATRKAKRNKAASGIVKSKIVAGQFSNVTLDKPNYKLLYMAAMRAANEQDATALRPYFDKFVSGDTSKLTDAEVSTVAKICFVEAKGAQLSQESLAYRAKRISMLMGKIDFSKDAVPVIEKKRKSIAEILTDKTRDVLLEVDECLDRGDYKKSFADLIEAAGTKAIDNKLIDTKLRPLLLEYAAAAKKTDTELTEAYSGVPAREAALFIGNILKGAMDFNSEKISTRKPRAKKKISPEKLVAKLNYLKEDKELGITSVDPKKIIGATQVWVYNVKTRKLGVYNSVPNQVMTLKGSTLQFFDENTSVCKKVRKPLLQVVPVVKAGKVELRHTMANIRAVAAKMTGRINGDTLIIKVV